MDKAIEPVYLNNNYSALSASTVYVLVANPIIYLYFTLDSSHDPAQSKNESKDGNDDESGDPI